MIKLSHFTPTLFLKIILLLGIEITTGHLRARDIMYRYCSLLIFLIPIQALAIVIDFETPALGLSGRQIINPYTNSGVTFTTPTGTFGDEVVGLVKNNSTSACVEPADNNQKLGTGRGDIGLSGFEIRATFTPPLNPAVSISVEFQTLNNTPVRIRLFDSSNTLVAESTGTTPANGGTCGFPGTSRGRITLSVGSGSPVAYAIMDLASETGGKVFVIDNFEVQQSAFPLAGVDKTRSLGKFSLRLTQPAGQAWFGIPDCPWGNPNCLIHSPLLYDSQTQIGRSNPHQDGDITDEINGAKICQSGTSDSCSLYLPKQIKDNDFPIVPPLDGVPFDEGPSGTKEIHTQILSLNMTDLGKCGTKTKNVVRAGLIPGVVGLLPSIGEVESLNTSLSSDFPAESFFDMFVEVDVDLGPLGVKTLYNNQPLLIQNAQLDRLPPVVIYTHNVSNTSPLVYDKPTGYPIGWLELAGHGVGYDECNQEQRSTFEKTYNQMIEEDLGLIAKGCYPILPQPELQVSGVENYEANGQQWTRYKLAITNYDLFPPALFQSAPNLPACGLNANSSRTWVDIYEGGGPRLYGFCALNSPEQLKDLWFAVPKGQKPPQCVQVELNDRQCNLKYLSNRVCDYTPGTIQFSQAEYSVNENQGRVTAWVERNGGSKGDIHIKYGTTSLTAQAGVDYQPMSGELTWQDGEMTAKPIDITIVNDNEREENETFYVTLLDGWGNPSTPQFNKPLHVPITIKDDDFIKIDYPPIIKSLLVFTPGNVIITNPLKLPTRLFSFSMRKTKDRDEDGVQQLFDDQSLAFIDSLPETLAELNLPAFTLETDGQIIRLELPIFSADEPQLPQAWYSVWVGDPVELASEAVPSTGILTNPAEDMTYLVFEGYDGKYYQAPLYPALHPQILAALTEAFPQATLTLSPEGRIIFTQGDQTTQVKASYVVTPSGLDTEPLTIKSLGNNQLELSAYSRSQQVELVNN